MVACAALALRAHPQRVTQCSTSCMPQIARTALKAGREQVSLQLELRPSRFSTLLRRPPDTVDSRPVRQPRDVALCLPEL